jgi:23S rRNA pseudouridine1911/1915/1917 synthase
LRRKPDRAAGVSARSPEPVPGVAGQVRMLSADRGDAGLRLDRVLLRHLADAPGASRTRIQHWIDEGRVLVNDRRPPKPSARVAWRDRVRIELPSSPPRKAPEPEARDLVVLHEDRDGLVVDKPAGMVAHPAYKHPRATLLNALLWRGRTSGAAWVPRLVHRLDKHTSGVLLVAKSTAAHAALTKAWRAPGTRKTYLAIVAGRPSRRRGEIRLRLDRDPGDRRRVVVSEGSGRDCVTRYEVLATSRGTRAGISLLACELLTGRMHQIRVHLAAIGLPIIGDAVYGTTRLPVTADARLAACVRDFPRQALHAWRLCVEPGGDVGFVDVEAPLPGDMRALLGAGGIDVERALPRATAVASSPSPWRATRSG